jgi:single-strand DNA-binding protein
VAQFTVASTPRYQDRNGDWKDGEALFQRCSAWRQLAENVAELNVGDRLVVFGQLRQRNWETKEGERRSSIELVADDVGVSVKFNPAESKRPVRGKAVEPDDDPWASPSPSAGEEPPF